MLNLVDPITLAQYRVTIPTAVINARYKEFSPTTAPDNEVRRMGADEIMKSVIANLLYNVVATTVSDEIYMEKDETERTIAALSENVLGKCKNTAHFFGAPQFDNADAWHSGIMVEIDIMRCDTDEECKAFTVFPVLTVSRYFLTSGGFIEKRDEIITNDVTKCEPLSSELVRLTVVYEALFGEGEENHHFFNHTIDAMSIKKGERTETLFWNGRG